MHRLTGLALALLASTSFVLAACGDDDADTSGAADTAANTGHGEGGHEETSEVADGAREVEVRASSFAFDPDELTVTAGEDVAIVLTSEDILHDFTVDELDAHVVAEGGETATGGLRAEEPGEYTYYCTVDGHREAGMEGTLLVEAS